MQLNCNQTPLKAKEMRVFSLISTCERPGTRTLNRLIKSQLLCQLS